MPATHKYQHAGLVGRTNSPISDVRRMVESCVKEQQLDWFRDIGSLSIASQSGDAYEVNELGLRGARVLGFRVGLSSDTQGTSVRVSITFFRTSQNKLYYFIPAGPKLMSGYKGYKAFLARFEATLREADRGAVLQISDQADQLPIPAGSGR